MIESLLGALGIGLALLLMWANDRWVQPWMTRRWVRKILARIQAGDYVPPAKQSNCGISIDATGITINKIRPSYAQLHSIAWSDILQVTAFKRDWVIMDCICIAIVTQDNTTTEVNEEMEGWEELTTTLPKHLPGSKQWDECFLQIAFPAFATNETEIYTRK